MSKIVFYSVPKCLHTVVGHLLALSDSQINFLQPGLPAVPKQTRNAPRVCQRDKLIESVFARTEQVGMQAVTAFTAEWLKPTFLCR